MSEPTKNTNYPEYPLVCVLCGALWEGPKNRCECGGFCTWGPAKGANPDSWIVTEKGWIPRPLPPEVIKES